MKRGAQLYDVFMTMRHERPLTEKIKEDHMISLWTVAAQLATNWKADDERERQGRRSWQYVPKLIVAGAFAWLRGTTIGFDGTGRYGN